MNIKQLDLALKIYVLEWEWYNQWQQEKLYFVTKNGTRMTTPCILEYAKRDLNAIKHNAAVRLLGLTNGYDYSQYSDYDTDNIGTPYQMYFTNWKKTISAVIKELQDAS